MKIKSSNNSINNELVAGTPACFADIATFPFDTAKVRLQLQGETTALANQKSVSNNTSNLLEMKATLPLAPPASNNALQTIGRGFISIAFPVLAHEITDR